MKQRFSGEQWLHKNTLFSKGPGEYIQIVAENPIQSFICLWGLLFFRKKRRGERESSRERKRKKKDGEVVF